MLEYWVFALLALIFVAIQGWKINQLAKRNTKLNQVNITIVGNYGVLFKKHERVSRFCLEDLRSFLTALTFKDGDQNKAQIYGPGKLSKRDWEVICTLLTIKGITNLVPGDINSKAEYYKDEIVESRLAIIRFRKERESFEERITQISQTEGGFCNQIVSFVKKHDDLASLAEVLDIKLEPLEQPSDTAK